MSTTPAIELEAHLADDIVERLRNGGARCGWSTDFAACPAPDDCEECACAREAAEEIERLREKVEDLRMYAEQDACAIESQQSEIERLQCQPRELPALKEHVSGGLR